MSAPDLDTLLAGARSAQTAAEREAVRELRRLARQVLDGEVSSPEALALRLDDLRRTVDDLDPVLESVRQIRRLAKKAAQREDLKLAADRANAARQRVEAEAKAARDRIDAEVERASSARTAAGMKLADADSAWEKLTRLVPAVALERLRAVQAERAPLAERVRAAQAVARGLAVQPVGSRTQDHLRARLKHYQDEADRQQLPGFARGSWGHDYTPEIERAKRELQEHEAVLADVAVLTRLEAELEALNAAVAHEQAVALASIEEAEGPGGEGLLEEAAAVVASPTHYPKVN